jgi:hypothetical protein
MFNVGIQEGQAGKADTLESSNYIRIVAGPIDQQARGDAELWLSKALPWAFIDNKTITMERKYANVTAVGAYY